eukprot:Phypoly_transcript_07658.p1 GENE.Phypoly_transcript_07658~~Phypoly_transcript_07658.p1  ORF type:complete len:468 (+),score=100.30 Phypoly_transcript_07658:102-1505(+)
MAKRKQVIEVSDEEITNKKRTKREEEKEEEKEKETHKEKEKEKETHKEKEKEREIKTKRTRKVKEAKLEKSTTKNGSRGHKKETEQEEPNTLYTGRDKGTSKKGGGGTKKNNEEILPFKKGFKLATKEQQIAALAFASDDIPRELFPFGTYTTQNGKEVPFFPNIPHPVHEDDWLAQYNVRQQSFTKWKELYRKIREGRDKIYFLPFGDFEEGPDLDILVEYAKIIYSPLKIEKLPNLEITHSKEGSCVKHTKNTRRGTSNVTTNLDSRRCHRYYKEKYVKEHRQLGLDALARVLEDMRPTDAYCILGLTMEDLYTDDTDEFTVGAANFEGAGGFSFARYNPTFNSRAKNEPKSLNTDEENKRILLRRCLKVMIHELGHMFALDHCVYFHCLMNGSGHIIEDDSQPLHMCPVDLRKLTYALQDDKRSKDFSAIRKQYELLHQFYEKYNFTDDKRWVHSMLQYLDKKE